MVDNHDATCEYEYQSLFIVVGRIIFDHHETIIGFVMRFESVIE